MYLSTIMHTEVSNFVNVFNVVDCCAVSSSAICEDVQLLKRQNRALGQKLTDEKENVKRLSAELTRVERTLSGIQRQKDSQAAVNQVFNNTLLQQESDINTINTSLNKVLTWVSYDKIRSCMLLYASLLCLSHHSYHRDCQ